MSKTTRDTLRDAVRGFGMRPLSPAEILALQGFATGFGMPHACSSPARPDVELVRRPDGSWGMP